MRDPRDFSNFMGAVIDATSTPALTGAVVGHPPFGGARSRTPERRRRPTGAAADRIRPGRSASRGPEAA